MLWGPWCVETGISVEFPTPTLNPGRMLLDWASNKSAAAIAVSVVQSSGVQCPAFVCEIRRLSFCRAALKQAASRSRRYAHDFASVLSRNQMCCFDGLVGSGGASSDQLRR